ncbi:hypothetical protein YC2023_060160 [Brassica napus]
MSCALSVLGQFTIDLPSDLHAIPDLDKACSIKPLSVRKPYRCSHKIHRGIKLTWSNQIFKLVRSTDDFISYDHGTIRSPNLLDPPTTSSPTICRELKGFKSKMRLIAAILV